MTIISHKHKFIFVQPRKVASSRIIASLSPLCGDNDVVCFNPINTVYRPDLDDDAFGAMRVRNNHIFHDLPDCEGGVNGHITATNVRNKVGYDLWDDYFKFTVIRDPWDWFLSLYWWGRYEYLNTPPPPPPPRPIYYARYLRYVLNRYRAVLPVSKGLVERGLRGAWVKRFMDGWPGFYFLDGRPYADCYLRFENLQEDFDRVCRRLGFPARVLPRTKSRVGPKGLDYRGYYTDWARDYIGRRFGDIIDTFGYSF